MSDLAYDLLPSGSPFENISKETGEMNTVCFCFFCVDFALFTAGSFHVELDHDGTLLKLFCYAVGLSL